MGIAQSGTTASRQLRSPSMCIQMLSLLVLAFSACADDGLGETTTSATAGLGGSSFMPTSSFSTREDTTGMTSSAPQKPERSHWKTYWPDCRRGVPPTTVAEGDLHEDVTWSGTVLLKGTVRAMPGVTLRIASGTHIVAEADAQLVISADSNMNTGKLTVTGESNNPVIFCGKEKRVGAWKGLRLDVGSLPESAVAQSELNYTMIEDAVVGIWDDIGIGLYHTWIKGANIGYSQARSTRRESTVYVSDSRTAVIARSPQAYAPSLPHFDVEMADNEWNVHELDFDVTDSDAILPGRRNPYLIRRRMKVSGKSLTMEPGAKIGFFPGAGIDIEGQGTGFRVNGSFLRPVVLESAMPGVAWGGIDIKSKVANVELNNAHFHGVSGSFALAANDWARLGTLVFEDCLQGLSLVNVLEMPDDSPGGGPIAPLGDLEFRGMTQTPVLLHPLVLGRFESGKIKGAEGGKIEILGGAVRNKARLPAFGPSYHLKGDLRILRNAGLTIEPGVSIEMSTGVRVEALSNSMLIAEGTKDKPISIFGEMDYLGYWESVFIGDNAGASFKHVRFSHGGLPGAGILHLEGQRTVTNCIFEKSAGSGIVCDSRDETPYATQNTFVDMKESDVIRTSP